ncbi:MAG TPA: prenyltransferase/squalene oxidase repeat-containing protein [Candidatus Paceibacterota bacterium]|nr:prenyltransferase/squalene oxidase repeat-containing protein [Candidatus Paceibacterota bacterium]
MQKIKSLSSAVFGIGFFLLIAFVFGNQIALADVNLIIQDGNVKLFEGAVALPEGETVELTDSTGTPRTIDAKSVLSIVNTADLLSENFNISELQYFSSFESLYLKCINGSTGNKCDDWQFVVNGNYPQEGMDKTILSGNETVYVYFGSQSKITLSASSIYTNGTVTVTAFLYDYENNSWTARGGVTIGATQPNPSDPWTPLEIVTMPVDNEGKAIFSSLAVGTYNFGVKEDYYFPTEELVVTAAPSSGGGGGGGGSSGGGSSGSGGGGSSGSSGGGSSVTPAKPVTTTKEENDSNFNINNAFKYLVSQQEEGGSFGADLFTEWTAIAFFGNSDFPLEKAKLFQYLATNKPTGNTLTDIERRAMALMALGLNPYGTNGENYIQKIVDSYKGNQFGDTALYNDDVFAIIVLLNAGYSTEEKMIQNAMSFIISKQMANGSWNDSPDMTGASIVALSNFPLNSSAKNSIAKAKDFLKRSQKENGGFGNVSSTAWAMQGILAMGEKIENWKHGTTKNTAYGFLKNVEDTTGGIKNENEKNKLWETSYVLSSLSGKNWNELMKKFEKKEGVGAILSVPANRAGVENNIGAFQASQRSLASRDEISQEIRRQLEEMRRAGGEKLGGGAGLTDGQKLGNDAGLARGGESEKSAEREAPQKRNWLVSLVRKIFGL